MLQDVWNENVNWDDIVSSNIIRLFQICMFSVHLRYCLFDKVVETQLVGFCDASERAYAAVVYLRSVDEFVFRRVKN